MNKKIQGFDGLRAIAVILVFFEHFVINGYSLGGLGVRIFFVLSGFLIIGILHKQRELVDSNSSSLLVELKKFWIRRARRIFPIYYLTLVLLLGKFIAQSKSIHTDGLLWYFILSSNIYIEYRSHSWGEFAHLWSISVEQHFYMLSSPILLFFSRIRHQLIIIIIFIVAIATLLANLLNGANITAIYVSSIVNFGFMAIGGLIAINNHPRKSVMLYGIIASLSIPFYIYLSASKKAAILYPVVVPFLCFIISLIGCASLIKYVSSNQSGLFVRLLEWRPLSKLGEISYGFYVYHFFAPRLSSQFHSSLLIKLWPLFQFTFSVVVAWISWTLIEQRFMKPRPTNQL
jgi:peptidoglycan/LPS O-acetylase OafA/YrhL